MRSDLTKAQRSVALKRRKAIYLELHPDTKAGVAGAIASNKAQGNTTANNAVALGFVKATAEATGKSERAVYQDIARADKLGDDAEAIVGTSLDSGVQIDALVVLPAPARAALVERAQAERSGRPAVLAASWSLFIKRLLGYPPYSEGNK
jgi:ParB family transcriptional regulator, chromosome partitioning protein